MGHDAKLIYLLAYCNRHSSLIMTIILGFRLASCYVFVIWFIGRPAVRRRCSLWLWFGSSDVPLYDVVDPFLVISGFRVLISGICVSPTFTMGIDIYVIYCGSVKEIRSMTFLFIFENIFVILIDLLLIFQLLIYHSLALWLLYVYVISLIIYHFIWYL